MLPSEHDEKHKHSHASKRRLHKDWRAWMAVALMLSGMLAYVLSDDESLQVRVQSPQSAPAAAQP
jgi:hypothetical protein